MLKVTYKINDQEQLAALREVVLTQQPPIFISYPCLTAMPTIHFMFFVFSTRPSFFGLQIIWSIADMETKFVSERSKKGLFSLHKLLSTHIEKVHHKQFPPTCQSLDAHGICQ